MGAALGTLGPCIFCRPAGAIGRCRTRSRTAAPGVEAAKGGREIACPLVIYRSWFYGGTGQFTTSAPTVDRVFCILAFSWPQGA
jgi:hypothetical protein